MSRSDRLETVKSAVTKGGRAIARKAKELTEITKLKAQIISCEDIIRKNYLEIGQKVYEAFEEFESEEEDKDPEAARSLTGGGDSNWEMRYKKHCTAIRNANLAIEDLRHRIAKLQEKE